MTRSLAAAVFALAVGCASLSPPPPVGLSEKTFAEATMLLQQGNLEEARAKFLGLAGDPEAARFAEEARFHAACILLRYNNPAKNYAAAAREFEAFLITYPTGSRADEARSWIALIRELDQSQAMRLHQEFLELSEKLKTVEKQLQETREHLVTLTADRDALAGEKSRLSQKVDSLLNDKDTLLRDKGALLANREQIFKEKTSLEKKVDALTREKENLIQKKEKLEQDIKDLKMLDVKMERKRKKVK